MTSKLLTLVAGLALVLMAVSLSAQDKTVTLDGYMLAPYWANRLGKTVFRAFQASRRGGEITCRLSDDRVKLEGACVFYLEGEVEIDN